MKIIVDVGRPQHWYVGEVDSLANVISDIKAGKLITLRDVYQIVSLNFPAPTGDIVCNTRVTPCAFNRGAVKSMLVKPVAAFQADLEEAGYETLLHQIKICEEDTALQSAEDAGIDTSAGRKSGPKGMLS